MRNICAAKYVNAHIHRRTQLCRHIRYPYIRISFPIPFPYIFPLHTVRRSRRYPTQLPVLQTQCTRFLQWLLRTSIDAMPDQYICVYIFVHIWMWLWKICIYWNKCTRQAFFMLLMSFPGFNILPCATSAKCHKHKLMKIAGNEYNNRYRPQTANYPNERHNNYTQKANLLHTDGTQRKNHLFLTIFYFYSFAAINSYFKKSV